jgi:cytidylate kinase
MPHPVIAVDGTAASGKSTFSRALASHLGYTYVNTGAMYRGVTWHMQQKGIDLASPDAMTAEITSAKVETTLVNGELAFRINGVDPLPHVRDAKVNEGVSLVSQVAAVRKILVAQQQRLADTAPVVMEGRDIGSVVFPQTPYKFFLDADPEVRAQRRSAQGETDAIQKRDQIDSQRKESPLTLVDGAVKLDSGHNPVPVLVAMALDHLASLGLPGLEPRIPLWAGPAPHSHGSAPDDIPTLTLFLPKKSAAPTPAVIVCPGGGYEHLAGDYEGGHNARFFQEKGVAAFVLKYRLPIHGYRHPVPLLDAQRAIRLVRSRAAEWNIDPTKIGIMGFSAGGHLASTVITHFDSGNPQAAYSIDRVSSRPDFSILVYPVISMAEGITHSGSKANLLGPKPALALVASVSSELQVTPQTPPTILVHALDDEPVPIENSRLMHAALQKAGVPSALHEYPEGKHGFGHFPGNEGRVQGWLQRAYDWLKSQSLV